MDGWWKGECEGSSHDGALDVVRVEDEVPGHIESGLGAGLVCDAVAKGLDLGL